MQETRQREVRNLIGGSWEEANGRQTEPVYDPATGEVIGMREQRGPDETSPWTVLRTEVVDTAPGAP